MSLMALQFTHVDRKNFWPCFTMYILSMWDIKQIYITAFGVTSDNYLWLYRVFCNRGVPLELTLPESRVGCFVDSVG